MNLYSVKHLNLTLRTFSMNRKFIKIEYFVLKLQKLF